MHFLTLAYVLASQRENNAKNNARLFSSLNDVAKPQCFSKKKTHRTIVKIGKYEKIRILKTDRNN